MSEKEPKERDKYMKDKKENLDRPPAEKEGLEEPKVEGLPKVKVGFVVFIIIVLIILVILVSTGAFGIFPD